MATIAAIGAAAWPFLRAWAPSFTPKLTLALIALLGLVVSHGAVAGYVWFQGYESRLDALAERDAHWRDELEKAKVENEQKVQAARAAAEAELPSAADRPGRVQQCGKSPTCRDRGRQ